jgi:hypothetical protein
VLILFCRFVQAYTIAYLPLFDSRTLQQHPPSVCDKVCAPSVCDSAVTLCDRSALDNQRQTSKPVLFWERQFSFVVLRRHLESCGTRGYGNSDLRAANFWPSDFLESLANRWGTGGCENSVLVESARLLGRKVPPSLFLDVGGWMLAVGCWLLAVGCWLLAVGCLAWQC